MMAIAPTLDIYLPYLIGFLYIAWCGAIVLSMLEVMRRPECRIKQYSSHTLFLSAFIWELKSTYLILHVYDNLDNSLGFHF